MRKALPLLLALIMCLSLCSCGVSSSKNPVDTEPIVPTTEPSLVEKMEQAESIEELKTYFVFGKSTKEEAATYYRKRNEFFLAQMSGYYYNRVPLTNAVNSFIKMGREHKLEDNRAVYYVSRDEVYFMPYSEQQMIEMGLTLEDIPDMENAEVYRYAVDEQYGNSGSMTFHSCYFDESAYEDYRSLELYCGYDDGSISIYGFFPDETTEPDCYTKDNTPYVGGGRYYYLSIDAALEAKAEAEAETAEYNREKEALKSSPPQIGMTADEVRRCAWGSPDKINKDVYSWGVEEQWVYDDHGYVYLKDGIVTSIQYR